MAANAQMENKDLMNKLPEVNAFNDVLIDDSEDVLELPSFGFERLYEPAPTFEKSQTVEQMKSIPEVTTLTTSFPAIAHQLTSEFSKFATHTLESVETIDSDSAIAQQTSSEFAKFATNTLESVETIDSEEVDEYGDDVTELPSFLKRQMSAPAPSMLPMRQMFRQGRAAHNVVDSSASIRSEQFSGPNDGFESDDERIDDTFNLRSLLKRQTSAPAQANPIHRLSMPSGHGKKVPSMPHSGANANCDDLAFKPSHFPRQETELSLPDDGFCRLETEQRWPAWPEAKVPAACVAGSAGNETPNGNCSGTWVKEMPQQPVEIPAWQYMWMLNTADNFAHGMPTSFDVPTQQARGKPSRRRRQMAPRPPSLIDLAAMEQQLPLRQVQPKNSKSKSIRNQKHVASKNISHKQGEASSSKSQVPSFCPFCGGKALPQFKFCQFCGADVASVRS